MAINLRDNFLYGVYDGIYKEYYETGILKEKITFVNGTYEGLYSEYYPNGKIYFKCYYKDLKLDGLYEEYSNSGALIKFYNYVNGNIVE